MIVQRRSLWSAVLLGVAALLPVSLIAQNGTPAEAPAAEQAPRRQLPDFFGKLAVSEAQREQLLKVDADYEVQIEALRDQIRTLIKERDAALEAHLTPGQKLRLSELRAEARQQAADQDGDEASTAGESPPPAGSPTPPAADTESN